MKPAGKLTIFPSLKAEEVLHSVFLLICSARQAEGSQRRVCLPSFRTSHWAKGAQSCADCAGSTVLQAFGWFLGPRDDLQAVLGKRASPVHSSETSATEQRSLVVGAMASSVAKQEVTHRTEEEATVATTTTIATQFEEKSRAACQQ
jgi:hypothetical protein